MRKFSFFLSLSRGFGFSFGPNSTIQSHIIRHSCKKYGKRSRKSSKHSIWRSQLRWTRAKAHWSIQHIIDRNHHHAMKVILWKMPMVQVAKIMNTCQHVRSIHWMASMTTISISIWTITMKNIRICICWAIKIWELMTLIWTMMTKTINHAWYTKVTHFWLSFLAFLLYSIFFIHFDRLHSLVTSLWWHARFIHHGYKFIFLIHNQGNSLKSTKITKTIIW